VAYIGVQRTAATFTGKVATLITIQNCVDIDYNAPRPVEHIKVGDTFYGQIGDREDLLLLRTFDGVVNLRSPRETWGVKASVKNYQPVDLRIEVRPRNNL
jgi:hypothetical protein